MKIITIIIVIALAAAIYYFMSPDKPENNQNRDSASKLTVTPHLGIGPVKFGISKDDVIKLLGKPDNENGMNLSYASQGFDIFLRQGQGVAIIICVIV